MRSPDESDSRHTTSSRQSPSRSAVSVGTDLVPLFDATPLADSSRLVVPLAYLSMCVLSSSSRVSSPSQYTTKLVDPGMVPRLALVVAENIPLVLDDHISAPGLLASTSSATQRPVSSPSMGPCWMMAQVLASRTWYAGWVPSSLHMKNSSPGREGIRSP